MAADDPHLSIDDLRRGSDVAWNETVRALGPPLRAFVAVRGAREPDDLVADVFLDLARGIDRIQGGWPAVRTLAFVIARRRLVDEFRVSARRPVEPLDTTELVRLATVGDAEQDAMERLSQEWVGDLLGLLTPIQRDVLTLRFVCGLTIREVAEITGSTSTGVKANQRRAVAALRRHLADELDPAEPPRPSAGRHRPIRVTRSER